MLPPGGMDYMEIGCMLFRRETRCIGTGCVCTGDSTGSTIFAVTMQLSCDIEARLVVSSEGWKGEFSLESV